MLFVLGNKFKQAKERIDFPHPDGPTIAVVRFCLKEKEKESKIFFSKPFSKKETERFFIYKAIFFFKTKYIQLKPQKHIFQKVLLGDRDFFYFLNFFYLNEQ